MTYFSVFLIVFISAAHSILGERYILQRLFRQPLPSLFGSDEFTKNTLRFAWHITSVAWLGFAFLLVQLSDTPPNRSSVLTVISVTFAITALIALAGSRGRHLSWLVFSAISLACYAAI